MHAKWDHLVGMEGRATVAVTPELTVRHHVPAMPAVYSTVSMILLMEIAAGEAIQAALPAGWVSVGVDVQVRHTAATPVGRTVTGYAKVTEVSDKLVTFDVEVRDGERVVGAGMHSRAPIDVARFERSLAALQAE